MQNLTRASNELFRRTPDECFPSLQALWEHCHKRRESSLDHWHPPQSVRPHVEDGELKLAFGGDPLRGGSKIAGEHQEPSFAAKRTDIVGGDRPFQFNDWSFAQLCRLANVSKDTINRRLVKECGFFDGNPAPLVGFSAPVVPFPGSPEDLPGPSGRPPGRIVRVPDWAGHGPGRTG